MLRLITGKAGTGKTALVINEIRDAVERRQGGRILIVPEQYSHEAERELCRVCADTMSRYAEVLSFTGLARRVASRQGGGCTPYLDKGGRLLCMALALSGISTRLRVYGAAARKAELQSTLLSAVDEMKTACVTPEMLVAAAEECGGALGDKLADLALIAEAYDAVVANGRADPADRLTVLVRQIPESELDGDFHIYVDGFTDFTRQEREILTALMKNGVELTVCLTMDAPDGDNEIYALSRRSAGALLAAAHELGLETRAEKCTINGGKNEALSFFADNMFTWSSASGIDTDGAVSLFCAESVIAECELAAARARELVRDRGCRWRDIAVAVRGFDDYRTLLESVFEHYEVPLFVSKKSDLMQRPLPTMIALAYEIVSGGWAVDDVVSYIRTGLTGLGTDECDTLENYIFKWQLQGGAWTGSGDWRQHPDGYGNVCDDEAKERLREINALRRRVSGPLLAFEKKAREGETATAQAAALAELFAALKLPERLEERSRELYADGRESLAQEYLQLWDIIVSALEQSAAILGDAPMSMDEFGKLFTLMLSKYDVGTIPVSLDRVSAGDFDRMRRRSIKHLIVLGADDERVPRAGAETGMFSDDERRRLLEMDIDLGGAGECELWREFSLIYNCLTLPSESLMMSYSAVSADGAEQRPSFVMNRAAALFDMRIKRADATDARMSAEAPAMTLAAHALRGGGEREQAAAEYFRRERPERFERLLAASETGRGRLSRGAVEALYGRELKLSASRVDRFASCKFAYFCQYGLKAKPYEPAGFTPPEIGTFMHYVLENTAREVKTMGGFRAVSDEQVEELTDKYVRAYVKEELNDFQEKSARFVYLFERLTRDVSRIVSDMAEELRRSDFEPLSFELDFANATELPPVELGEGEGKLTLTGIADRVDGWLHNGKLYIRVVDYKTGKKKFSLSDVWYGMGLQMLLYLFALEEDGEKLYGHDIAPAGVMYVPARNAMVAAQRDPGDEEAEGLRREESRRSGLVLDDAEVIEAWENGADKRYIPVKTGGRASAESLAGAERLGLLSRHIKETLTEMAGQLRRGDIAADPFYRSQQENACMNCDYSNVCHFVNGCGGESCKFMPKLPAEKVWTMLEGGEEK